MVECALLQRRSPHAGARKPRLHFLRARVLRTVSAGTKTLQGRQARGGLGDEAHCWLGAKPKAATPPHPFCARRSPAARPARLSAAAGPARSNVGGRVTASGDASSTMAAEKGGSAPITDRVHGHTPAIGRSTALGAVTVTRVGRAVRARIARRWWQRRLRRRPAESHQRRRRAAPVCDSRRRR